MGATDSPRSDRGFGFAIAVAVATAALVWIVAELRQRTGGSVAASTEARVLQAQVAALERRIIELETSQRTLASLSTMREPRATKPSPDAGVVARTAQSNSGALASKPMEEAPDAAERARRVGDLELANALERATAPPSLDEITLPPASTPLLIQEAPFSAPNAAGDGAAPSDAVAAEEAPKSDAETAVAGVIAAFNQLLRDAGLDGWKLIACVPDTEGRCLGSVVLARVGLHGTAIGSLSAKKLTLQRDAVTGVAGFELTGARGTESGIEVAFENNATRVDIPGILPLDLLAPCLRDLFAIGTATDTTDSLITGDQVTRAVNRILALEKAVSMRVRSVDRLEERTLKKAVIDLTFDEHGEPLQTVVADSAWFEVDPSSRYGELHCEGGDMVEKGLRRPLYRGKLRVPLLDIKPEQWQGMPAARVVNGS